MIDGTYIDKIRGYYVVSAFNYIFNYRLATYIVLATVANNSILIQLSKKVVILQFIGFNYDFLT